MPQFRFLLSSLTLLGCFLLGGGHLHAQPKLEAGGFRNLSRAEGLPRSSVFAIAQDSLGLLWFSTRGGVSRYDGHRFSDFQSQVRYDSVDQNVTVLYVDPLTQDIWMGSATGLIRYRQRTSEVKRFHRQGVELPGSIRGSVRCVFRDASGRLWVGTSNGLNFLNPRTGVFQRRYFPGHTDRSITFLAEAPDETLYIGTWDGLYALKPGPGATPQPMPVLQNRRLTAGLALEDGTLWLGTAGEGLYRWDPRTGALSNFTSRKGKTGSLSHSNISALQSAPDGSLWVGTTKGLNYLPAGDSTFVQFNGGGETSGEPFDDFIKSLLVDREGSLWAGTYYSGVQHLDERYNTFTNYRHDPHQNSLSGNIVSAFAETPSGDLFIGTEGDGLNRMAARTGAFRHFRAGPGSVSGNNIKRLLTDGGDLWIGTWQAGLNRYDTLTKTFTHYRHDPADPSSLGHNNTYALHREGDLLWIATYGAGLDLMDVANDTFAHFRHTGTEPNSLSSNQARTLLREDAHTFWIGTNAGLNRVTTDSSGYPARFERLFTAQTIYATYLSAKRVLWFGTANDGLFAYDLNDSSVRTYTTADGMSGNTVFGILPAECGNIWVSTENGLSVFNPVTESFFNFDHANGLRNKEYNYHAFYRRSNGQLLFGGLNGFTAFHPGRITLAKQNAPLVLTGLLRNGEPVKVGDRSGLLDRHVNEAERITFDYGESVFTVQFAALDYLSPENNRYAYKLEGLDRQWRYLTGKGEVSYTIQREGSYKLLLKVANGDGSWTEEARTLTIDVLAPPHRSWWAYLLYAALLLTAGLVADYFIRVRHRIQLQEVARRQQEELTEMKLRFFTNITHEFRTPLTLILGPLQQLLGGNDRPADERRQLSMVRRNAERLMNLVNQTLTFRKLVTDHEPIRAERVDADALLGNVFGAFRELALQRTIAFEYLNHAPGLELWLDVDKMEKVLYNLLSNAFKFTPDGGAIRITLRKNDTTATITVEDSGAGVEPAFRQDIFKRFYEKANGQVSTIKSSGIGLAISREMTKLHGGELTLAEPAGGKTALGGAVFLVEIPLGRSHFESAEVVEGAKRDLTPSVPEAIAVVSSTISPPPLPVEIRTDEQETPRILIVDDNPDILDYLQSILRGHYTVMTAANGKEGLLSARNNPPEAIISDVMMPEMDGLAFCDAVKTDLEISHIPVILLTAQTADAYRIDGLRNGADDYLTKPFNPTELLLRVRNQLRARGQSRQRFVTSLALEPQEITITNTDEEFLRRAITVVEEQIGNPDFKVDEFATAMVVSRSLLYTKIKALTDQTPNNFVRTLRLKRAAQLLRSGQFNVSEVTYEVGFRDLKYFRKCFKKQFDVVPSTYRDTVANASPTS